MQFIGTQVCAGAAASDILVDLEIYDAGGQKIAQRIFGGQSFPAGQGVAYSWDYVVPATLPDGVYTVKIGIFSGDWSTLHVWENHAAHFTVQAGAPIPGAQCTGGISIGPTTAEPIPITMSSDRHIRTRVCSGAAISDILVDLGIYAPDGSRVIQSVRPSQSFAAGEAKSYDGFASEPLGNLGGVYTVQVGVFSDDWSILYAWDARAATFQFGVGNPQPGGCTGGFTIGPTTAVSPVDRGIARGTRIDARICSGTAASNILVDLEIYDTGGQKIAQRIFVDQSFAAGDAITYTWPVPIPVTLPAGIYTVKIGVFSGDWSVLHQWHNQAATFTVR